MPTTSNPYPANAVAVTISMYESFRELPGGRCEGYGPFEGLGDNNIAYLTGATNRTGPLTGTFATGFTESATQRSPFYTCDITVTFSTDYPDSGGYYIQVGNPSQFKFGPYKAETGPTGSTGPYGAIRVRACPAASC
jgi:hypothetical protein